VLAVAVIAGGVGGWYGFGQPDRTVTPVSPRPSTSTTAPSPTAAPTSPTRTPMRTPTAAPGGGSTGTASSPATSSAPASTASSGYGALAGLWKQADGAAESLFIYPDGVLGVGEGAGANDPLCAGQLQPGVNGAYPFTAGCGIMTSGTITVANGTLTVHLPGSAGTVTWVPASTAGEVQSAQNGNAPPAWLVGTWSDGSESFKVASTGVVTWSFTNQQGKATSGTGTIEAEPAGTFRSVTTFGSPPVAGFWPIAHLIDGQLAVIGGEGLRTFSLSSH